MLSESVITWSYGIGDIGSSTWSDSSLVMTSLPDGISTITRPPRADEQEREPRGDVASDRPLQPASYAKRGV